MVCVISKKPVETEYIGQRMATFLKPGDFITLNGGLGAGKTVLSQGIAKGLGIDEPITSPTFTIIQEYYNGRLPFFHMDLYRLNSIQEMDDLGYEEYFYGDGVTIVEWGNRFIEILPEEFLNIEIREGAEGRELCFFPKGRHYERLVEELTGHDYSKRR